MGGRGSGVRNGMLLPHERENWWLSLLHTYKNFCSNDPGIIRKYHRETGVNDLAVRRGDLRRLHQRGIVSRKRMVDGGFRYKLNDAR